MPPLLMIEDDTERVMQIQYWMLTWTRLVVASSAGSAKGLLKRDQGRVYLGILLDHDLQQLAKTHHDRNLCGSDVVDSIIRYVHKDTPILVHSMNPAGAQRMVEKLKQAKFYVTRIPWAEMTKTRFQEWLSEASEIWDEYSD